MRSSSTRKTESKFPKTAERAAELAASLFGQENLEVLLDIAGQTKLLKSGYLEQEDANEAVLSFKTSRNPCTYTKFKVAKGEGRGKYDFLAYCDCGSDGSCVHTKVAFLMYYSYAIEGFRDAVERQAAGLGGISQESAELVAIIKKSSGKQKEGSPFVVGNGGKTFFYVLDEQCDSLKVISARKLTSGNLSEKFKVEEGWAQIATSGMPGYQSIYQGRHYEPYYHSNGRTGEFGQEDIKILRAFVSVGWDSYRPMSLDGVDPDTIFHVMGKTGRFIFGWDGYDNVISVGEPKKIDLEWKCDDQDRIKLSVKNESTDIVLLPTSPKWYLDKKYLKVGPVENAVSEVAFSLLKSGDVGLKIDDIEKVRKSINAIEGAKESLPEIPVIETLDMGIVQPVPVIRVRKSSSAEGGKGQLVTAEIEFDYLGQKASIGKESNIVAMEGGSRVKIGRDKSFEKSILAKASQGFGSEIIVEGSKRIVDSSKIGRNEFFSRAIGFQKTAEEFASENGWRIDYGDDCEIRVADAGELNVTLEETENGWYNLGMRIAIDGVEVSMIDILRQALKQPEFDIWLNEKSSGGQDVWYHELEDGRLLPLPQERVKKLARVMIELGTDSSEHGSLRVSRFDTGFLDEIGSDAKICGGESLRALAEALAAPVKALPERLESDMTMPLREYQGYGVQWLRKLKEAGVGAVLGDEMGAGKTLQVLCHIWLNSLENTGKLSLIVVPVSLVAKWVGDAGVFLPGLKFGKMLSGEAESWEQITSGTHAVITTYAMMMRHEEKFASIEWDVMAFDEAHELRNADSKLTHSAMRIKANQKIAITGTPLQNKQEEWWSIFTLVTPGLFRERKWFRAMFVNGAKNDDALRSERLKLMGRIASPFRLARTNAEVKNKLPDLEVEFHYVDLPQEQTEIYEAMRSNLDAEVRALIKESGLERNHIQVLTAINRLRQIAADPSLTKLETLPKNPASGKVDYIMSLCMSLLEEGKQVFIVSEWTEYLNIIASRLKENGASHRILHGKLSRDRREEVIASFRCGLARVLLSTYKVGGAGLDIPEGDAILIINPWWNPKVVDQAIGRLRRNDSDKLVKAYHIIARGTLEEGVIKIGERKRAMISAVTEGANEVAEGLSIKDIESLLGSF